jgi:chromosome segregation ATPase
MSETFATMIDKERERLQKALEDLRAKQEELQAQRATIEAELDALDTYEAARSGKARKTRGTVSRAPRGSRQQSVLAVIAKSKKGMTRGDILQAMGLKGNEAGERAVSNALTALKKAKRVTSRDRKYLAV